MRDSILKIRGIAYFVLDRGRQNDIKPNDFERDRNNGKPASDEGGFSCDLNGADGRAQVATLSSAERNREDTKEFRR